LFSGDLLKYSFKNYQSCLSDAPNAPNIPNIPNSPSIPNIPNISNIPNIPNEQKLSFHNIYFPSP